MSLLPSPGLDTYQWGLEGASTPGTLVPATSKIAVETMSFRPLDLVVRPKLANAIMLDNPGNELVVMRGTEWTAEGPVVFDQLQNWLTMLLKTITDPGGAAPATWQFTYDPTALNTIRTFTLERRGTDGTNPIDNEWGYACARSLRITGGENAPLRMTVEGFARRIQASTLTAGQALPVIEMPPTPLAKLWINPSWATLGTTQITGGQLIDFNILIKSGLKPLMSPEGQTDLDFRSHFRDRDEVGIEFEATMRIEASSGQYATEKTAAEAQSLRAVRLEVDGTSSRTIEIDFLAKHAAGSLFEWGSQDGIAIVTLRLVSASDLTNAFAVKVINTVTALI